MKITSKQQAFDILDSTWHRFPYDAVRYLYRHGRDPEILDKIVFSLTNAYNEEVYYDSRKDQFSDAPLWYGIVAETHMDERLVQPIIDIYKEEDRGWDLLEEQGNVLVGIACEELGEPAVHAFLSTVKKLAEEESDLPYLYLFQAFYYADPEKYGDLLLGLLENPESKWLEAIIGHLSGAQFTPALPRLRELLEYYKKLNNKGLKQNHVIIELKAAIEELETGVPQSEFSSEPYFKVRSPWEKHYRTLERNFGPLNPKAQPEVKKKKTGRNDPCHCGSGKKYKRCCWPD